MALKTINDLTALTTPASTDLVGVWAVGAARMRKSTIDQIVAGCTNAVLLAGRAGGQGIYGGTNASDNLLLRSTSNGTKGKVIIDQDAVGVMTATPLAMMHVVGSVYSDSPTTDTIFPFTPGFTTANFIGSGAYWAIRTAVNNSINFDVYNAGSPVTALCVLQNGYIGAGGIIDPETQFDIGAGAVQFSEMTAPSAGAANSARLFCRDNGGGKSQLCVIFATGAIQVLATEP